MTEKSTLKEDAPFILYISYDGLLEPLGKSQIVPYLIGLAGKGRRFVVLSFEKPADLIDKAAKDKLEGVLRDVGIKWAPLVYHKHPQIISTLLDIILGCAKALSLTAGGKCALIHVRSYVPAVIALALKKLRRIDFVFDMRGFWADERVESGIWGKGGIIYKTAKYFEKLFLKKAVLVVTLTEASKSEIQMRLDDDGNRSSIYNIPTCVDLDRFRLSGRSYPDMQKDGMVFAYAGSLSTWYMPDEIAGFYQKAVSFFPKARLIVCTRESFVFAKIAADKKLPINSVSVENVRYEDMPAHLQEADVGLAFYKSGYSRIACCPTKIGEYLACGLIVVATKGVGDTDKIIFGEGVGVIIDDMSDEWYSRALASIGLLTSSPDIRKRCRSVAQRYFSLDLGIGRYDEMYSTILAKR